MMTPDVVAVKVLWPYTIEVTFADGVRGRIDLADDLFGPVFEPLREPAFFEQAYVDAELGTVVWPNGADLSPEFLYASASAASRESEAVNVGGDPRI